MKEKKRGDGVNDRRREMKDEGERERRDGVRGYENERQEK